MRALAAVDLAADHALGVGDRDAALAALDEDDEADDHDHQGREEDDLQRVHARPSAGRGTRLMRQLGKSTTMPAKMMSEMPLPMPRSEICSPSHMTKTVPVVRVRMVRSLKPQPGIEDDRRPGRGPQGLEEDGDAEGLDEADDDRAVAGVLGDLLAAQLAFLGQPLEVGPDDRQQLEDDRRR